MRRESDEWRKKLVALLQASKVKDWTVAQQVWTQLTYNALGMLILHRRGGDHLHHHDHLIHVVNHCSYSCTCQYIGSLATYLHYMRMIEADEHDPTAFVQVWYAYRVPIIISSHMHDWDYVHV